MLLIHFRFQVDEGQRVNDDLVKPYMNHDEDDDDDDDDDVREVVNVLFSQIFRYKR